MDTPMNFPLAPLECLACLPTFCCCFFFFQSFYSYFSQMEMRERNEENVLLAQRDLQLGDIRIGVSVYGSRESECVRNATDG